MPQDKEELFPCPKCASKKLQTPFCDYCGKMHRLKIPCDTTYVANLTFRNGYRSIWCPVLLDSGANYSVFHGYYADLLGIDLTHAPKLEFSGISSGMVIGYGAFVEIELANKPYRIPVYFSYDLQPNVNNMLGVVGFRDRFYVHDVDGGVELEEKKLLQVKKYIKCHWCGSERKNASSNYCWSCGASLELEPLVGNDLPLLSQQQGQSNIISIQTYNPVNIRQMQSGSS